MSDESRQMGRITAIIEASEDVIKRASKQNLTDVIRMAKETAYDHIHGIIDDPAYCPWQE